ncbi:MAG: SDR family NAD(P)-dependent oxidoreductase [Oscillochloris sp.]|nr:SDR family NAD(P)-dependent oxidoreductase [Oscillochloris sp.]
MAAALSGSRLRAHQRALPGILQGCDFRVAITQQQGRINGDRASKRITAERVDQRRVVGDRPGDGATPGLSWLAGVRRVAPARRSSANAACLGRRDRRARCHRSGRIAAALTTVQQAAGRLDALVCNAGIQIRGYFEDLGDAELRQMFATNLFGAMATVRAALPHMRRAGRGRIVLVSSIGGRIGSPAMSGYCAGKFALEGFGEALALECAPLGIKVALVAPPIVATPIWTTNRAMAAATGPHSPYRRAFEAVERLTAGLVARAEVNSDQVAALIAHVLECAQPRLRYSAGRRASALLVLRRYLPELWFERAYRAVLLRVQTTGATGRQAWRNS